MPQSRSGPSPESCDESQTAVRPAAGRLADEAKINPERPETGVLVSPVTMDCLEMPPADHIADLWFELRDRLRELATQSGNRSPAFAADILDHLLWIYSDDEDAVSRGELPPEDLEKFLKAVRKVAGRRGVIHKARHSKRTEIAEAICCAIALHLSELDATRPDGNVCVVCNGAMAFESPFRRFAPEHPGLPYGLAHAACADNSRAKRLARAILLELCVENPTIASLLPRGRRDDEGTLEEAMRHHLAEEGFDGGEKSPRVGAADVDIEFAIAALCALGVRPNVARSVFAYRVKKK